MPRRQLLCGLSSLTIASAAKANETTIDMSRAVFVTVAGSRQVPFIDPETDRIAGQIDVAMVPDQLELAPSISKLLATDGTTGSLHIIDLITREIAVESLDIVPERMTVGPDGLTAAFAEPASGHVVLFDLLRRRTIGIAAGPAPLQDMVFSADSRMLYLSGGASSVIHTVDVATAALGPAIETDLPGIAMALTRAPNGRRLFVQSSSGPTAVLDLEHRRRLAPLATDVGSTAAYPSGSGAFLLVNDNRRSSLLVFRQPDAAPPAILPAAAGVSLIHTAWFDSLALVPSAARRSLLLYDLDALRPIGSVQLAAAPGHGGITPDGRKLYLPLPDAGRIVAYDASHRALAASIPIAGSPARVFLAGSYGVCH
jgi:hypothetical protein